MRGRRRPDPLADIFEAEVVPLLPSCPGLRRVAIWEELLGRHSDLGPGVRRTLERRVRVSEALDALHAQRKAGSTGRSAAGR